MPIRTIERDGYVEFHVTGAIDAEGIMEHIQQHFSVRSDKCTLWDMREADLSSLSVERFGDIVRTADSMKERRSPGPRSAVLAILRPDYLLASAFAARAEAEAVFPMKVFDDREEALAWLLEG